LTPIIIVTQDEYTFNSNDGRYFICVHKDHHLLWKKGKGQGLHISELLTPVGKLGDGTTCEILKCSGDGEAFGSNWNKAISAFEVEFPGCQALFLFDNAKKHHKYAKNSLQVSKMNMANGG
ncbi:hypothetical protein L873DRAFT_1626651, partial [Choiromyces venosus 120613-1]